MYIVVGLGNPDGKYAATRHNAGYLAIDMLSGMHGIDVKRAAFKSVVGEGRIGAHKVVLAKPITYMNNSGQAVVELLNWYKIDPEAELIVVYDDIDLPVGEIRTRARGSAGTHNGMRSIIYLTGNDRFPRVRVGIGKPQPGWDLAAYVLSQFADDERGTVKTSLEHAADAVTLMITEGLDAAQHRYNIKNKSKKAARAEAEAAAGDDTNPSETEGAPEATEC